jgi:hypothetical protein
MATLANNPWADPIPHGMTIPSDNASEFSLPHTMASSNNPSVDSFPSYITEADTSGLVANDKNTKNYGLPILEGLPLKLVVFSYVHELLCRCHILIQPVLGYVLACSLQHSKPLLPLVVLRRHTIVSS